MTDTTYKISQINYPTTANPSCPMFPVPKITMPLSRNNTKTDMAASKSPSNSFSKIACGPRPKLPKSLDHLI